MRKSNWKTLILTTSDILDHLKQKTEDRHSTNAKVATCGLCLVQNVMLKQDDQHENVKNLDKLYETGLLNQLL